MCQKIGNALKNGYLCCMMKFEKTILVCGGTTEGRRAIEALDEAGKPVIYTTRGYEQQVNGHNLCRVSGALDPVAMASLCRTRNVGLIVDAGHPFATQLHATVVCVGRQLGVPVIRFERCYPELDGDVITCDGYEDACNRLASLSPTRLLVLTGVQTISRLLPYTSCHPDTVYRVLDRDSSRAIAARSGIGEDHLVYYHPEDDHPEAVARLIRSLGVDAVITKESGISGGFVQKAEGVRLAGAKLIVVRRPVLPDGYSAVVEGPAGLRRSVERLLPGFYDLRSGLTTGTCAAAAAQAAAMLIVGKSCREVFVRLPVGDERIGVDVCDVRMIDNVTAEAVVIKDAGDDPDVTDGCSVVVRVRRESTDGPVSVLGGEGIGRVTLPGTGLDIGMPAINPVPKAMIVNAVRSVFRDSAAVVTVGIPGGEELAVKTFNPRIGIEGGLSIIGTTGIVRPFSHEAFVEAIRRELTVARDSNVGRVVVNSGGKSERAVKAIYPALPSHAFVHYGNAVGETLKAADELGISRLTIGMMIGKAVKVAEGQEDTHSHKVAMNRKFLARLASDAGCSYRSVDVISGLNMARELWSSLDVEDLTLFINALARRCYSFCRNIFLKGELEILIISDEGKVFCRFS